MIGGDALGVVIGCARRETGGSAVAYVVATGDICPPDAVVAGPGGERRIGTSATSLCIGDLETSGAGVEDARGDTLGAELTCAIPIRPASVGGAVSTGRAEVAVVAAALGHSRLTNTMRADTGTPDSVGAKNAGLRIRYLIGNRQTIATDSSGEGAGTSLAHICTVVLAANPIDAMIGRFATLGSTTSLAELCEALTVAVARTWAFCVGVGVGRDEAAIVGRRRTDAGAVERRHASRPIGLFTAAAGRKALALARHAGAVAVAHSRHVCYVVAPRRCRVRLVETEEEGAAAIRRLAVVAGLCGTLAVWVLSIRVNPGGERNIRQTLEWIRNAAQWPMLRFGTARRTGIAIFGLGGASRWVGCVACGAKTIGAQEAATGRGIEVVAVEIRVRAVRASADGGRIATRAWATTVQVCVGQRANGSRCGASSKIEHVVVGPPNLAPRTAGRSSGTRRWAPPTGRARV